jgi:predicted amidophosphoribosyltransferase
MLAKGISSATGIPLCENAVLRKVNNRSQTRKSKQERQKNVKNIFELNKENSVAGKHVLLVDDVLTSGATLESCANALLQQKGVIASLFTIAIAQ